jgi:uncharacterized LabA/DUF88 family protein
VFASIFLILVRTCLRSPRGARRHVDEMILFSGYGDFRTLSEVQRRGVRITVVSSIASQPPMIADELRRQADVFTDLTELRAKVSRDPSERPPPRERGEMRAADRAAHPRDTTA